VEAGGDLVQLAHIALCLTGEGEVIYLAIVSQQKQLWCIWDQLHDPFYYRRKDKKRK
jgi:histidine ammonia-lyase